MARNPNHPRTEIAPLGRCMCAARELVGLRQPVSPAAPRACDTRKTAVNHALKIPPRVQGPSPSSCRAVTAELCFAPQPSPEGLALPHALHHPQGAAPKSTGAFPPASFSPSRVKAAVALGVPWMGNHLRPQHLISLLSCSCFFLCAGRVFVTLAARNSRSLEAASKGGRKIKGTRYNPLSHGKHWWFAVPVKPQHSSLFELCTSPVYLLAVGPTAPKTSKFGASGSTGDGSGLGQVTAAMGAHEGG